MVTHWGMNGEPNGWMDKNVAILLLPAIMLGLAAVLYFIPKIDPLHKHYDPFHAVYEQFILVLLLFLAAIHITTIGWAMGMLISPMSVIAIGLAVLMVFIARLCEASEPNYFVGIRTPWALQDRDNWKATNRFGARLFYWAVPVCLLGFLVPAYAIWLILVAALVPAFGAVGYSYWYYSKKRVKRTSTKGKAKEKRRKKRA